MADGTSSKSEAGLMPTPEQFIRFLVENGDVTQVRYPVRCLIQIYAATWAGLEGLAPGRAIEAAETLFDEVTTPAAERLAEEER